MARTPSLTSSRYSLFFIFPSHVGADGITQYTTQLSVDATPQLVVPHGDDANNLVPVQIILVIKAKNQKKINSHRWLFNAIGKILQVYRFVSPLVGDVVNAQRVFFTARNMCAY